MQEGVGPESIAIRILKPRRGIEPTERFLNFLQAAGAVLARTVLARTVLARTVLAGTVLARAVLTGAVFAGTSYHATFGVFIRLEVWDVNFLIFLLCHFSFLSGSG